MPDTHDDATPQDDATPRDDATPQDDTTPQAASSAGSGADPTDTPADPRPVVRVRPSATFEAPMASRNLGVTWQIVAAMAVVVGLLTGVVTLLDRFSAAPAPPPAPVVTPAPTTPGIRVDVSSAAGAAELVAFAEAQTGNLVDLDLSCFETVATPACIFEASGLEAQSSGQEWLWLWVFTETPCFAPQLDQPEDSRDTAACQGTNLFWIDPRIDGSPVVLGNIQGAGTTAIKGPWELASPAGRCDLPGQHPRLPADAARDPAPDRRRGVAGRLTEPHWLTGPRAPDRAPSGARCERAYRDHCAGVPTQRAPPGAGRHSRQPAPAYDTHRVGHVALAWRVSCRCVPSGRRHGGPASRRC